MIQRVQVYCLPAELFFVVTYFIVIIIAPSLEEALRTMDVNFTGTLNVSRTLISILKPHSRIVNLSSFRGSLDRVEQNYQVILSLQIN